MESVIGFRGGGSAGATAVERDFMGISSDGQPDAELELGLGLSLAGCGGRGGGAKAKPSEWGGPGRILTAKDFPAGVPHSGSSSSIFSPKPTSAAAFSRTERVAFSDDRSPASASQLVGWPPIRSYRMNSFISNLAKSPTAVADNDLSKKDRSKLDASSVKNGNACVKEKRHVGFVKVNMDGVVIGRKVDLTSHSCYETLALTLENMFLSLKGSSGEKAGAKRFSKLFDGSSEFVLTYEDKEGDWMLVGDVPWKMFLSSVKKLRIMRTSEARGLAPRCQERAEKRRSRVVS